MAQQHTTLRIRETFETLGIDPFGRDILAPMVSIEYGFTGSKGTEYRDTLRIPSGDIAFDFCYNVMAFHGHDYVKLTVNGVSLKVA